MLSRLKAAMQALLRRSQAESELDEELRYHIERQIEQNIRMGMSPQEARLAARRAFGGVETAKERSRDARGLRWLEEIWHDLRYGARTLVRNPGFTLTAVATLSLGMGANTAIFSLVNTVFLHALPFPQPERIMTVWEETPADGIDDRQSFAPGNYSDMKAQQTVFAQIAALVRSEMNLTGDGEPEKLEGVAVFEPEAFDILGVKPAAGRLFQPGEYLRGANRVVLISHGFWQRRFGGAADAIGKELTLNDEKFVIAGALPPDFKFLNPDASFWTPAGYSQRMLAYRLGHSLTVIARLKPGVAEAQAQAEVKTIMRRIAQDHPAEAGRLSAFVQPLHEYLTGDVRRPFLVLLVAVGFVLLIACANLASLLLARSTTRRKEIAVRMALGAGRFRLVRQLLTESVILAGAGGMCGLLVAVWSFAMLRQLIPSGLAGYAKLGLDGQTLAFTLGLSLVTGVLFGLAPALQATRMNVNEALKQSGARSGAGHHRLQNALVVAEVALALVLTIGAGLLIQTFYRLRQVDVGFRVENTLTLQTRLPRARFMDHAKRLAFFRQTLERVRALPGVVSAAYASRQPLTSLHGIYTLTIEGRSAQGGAAMESDHRQVSPEYFATLGIPLRQGRVFDERDTLQTEAVAIINETMARRFWPGENPIGKRFAVDEDGIPASHPLTIVGVAGDVKHRGLENDVWPEFYMPYAQVDYNSYSIPGYLIVRAGGDPMSLAASVRQAIHSVNPDQPAAEIRTVESLLDEMVAQRRLRMALLAAYSGLALLLAAVGIYGSLAYFVMQRSSEIGLRVALGAQAADVLWLIIGKGMKLALIGALIGLGAAWALTRSMKSLLFGVSPTDPLTFITISILLMSVALLACFIPARRATKVDPMVALRRD
ncbi:MAG TPA: ABC transporter permease [Blastocatellia bacterium]|nr:ABC transporter permease [Blastocatellia bacterium]